MRKERCDNEWIIQYGTKDFRDKRFDEKRKKAHFVWGGGRNVEIYYRF